MVCYDVLLHPLNNREDFSWTDLNPKNNCDQAETFCLDEFFFGVYYNNTDMKIPNIEYTYLSNHMIEYVPNTL